MGIEPGSLFSIMNTSIERESLTLRLRFDLELPKITNTRHIVFVDTILQEFSEIKESILLNIFNSSLSTVKGET